MSTALRVEPGELFLPELTLGSEALTPEERTRIQEYLLAVVTQRGTALSVPSLWNALYFGWDLEARGYVAVPTAFEESLARLEMGGCHPAVPPGAIIRVAWGDGAFWAEVVHKDGAREEADADWLDPALSGAPAPEDPDGHPVLRERLVIDPAVFGPELAPDAHQLERLRRRGRWLDERGHLVIDAVYESAALAGLEDASFFARWMWSRHRPALAEGRLHACLHTDADEADLREAFLASLATVEDLARGAEGLGSWRSHFFPLAGYRERLASPEEPFNRDGLERLMRGLSRPPRGSRIAYAALGPRLSELERHGELVGGGYALAVCHAGAFIIERLAQDAPLGRDSDGVHLRLDDAWQKGGVWRAEQMASHGALCDLSPQLALGLGWAESQGISVGAEEGIALVAEESGEPEPEILRLEDQVAVFRVTLGPRHLENGLLRLPPEIADGIQAAGDDPPRIFFSLDLPGVHLDADLAAQEAVLDATARTLTGVVWPFAAYPGLHLLVSWRIGTRALSAHATLREAPLELAGHLHLWQCDEHALARALGLAELPRRASSLRALVLDTLRRRGHAGEDGTRRAAAGPLTSAIFGPHAPEAARAAVRLELELMEREGILARDGEVFVYAPRAQRPSRAPDLSSLRDYLRASAARREAVTRRHTVVLFLRRLPAGQRASAEKERDYADEIACEGLRQQLPAGLPPGYTYVSTHERGSGSAPTPDLPTGASLQPQRGHRLTGEAR